MANRTGMFFSSGAVWKWLSYDTKENYTFDKATVIPPNS